MGLLKPAGEVLASFDAALDEVNPLRGDVPPETLLSWVQLARRVRDRVDALAGVLVAEADRAHASVRVAGTPLSAWLGVQEKLSRREATRTVLAARNLADHPAVGHAAQAGRINPGQARAIGKVLGELAPQLDTNQQAAAEQVMVGLADRLGADELARSAGKVMAEVAPVDADQRTEERLQRAAETAYRQRSLRFFRDGASIRFDGSLPQLDGEAFIALVDAHQEARRRSALEARDSLADSTPEQRRADALVALLEAARSSRPEAGVGLARVVVTVDYERLAERAAAAGRIGENGTLSAGELRQACCDAEIVPAVLGSSSEVLDVGRASRLVTGGIRTALSLRDGGCVFPGCDVTPNKCEAHHIRPWWSGTPTALRNLALLCHHHHGMIEPAKFTSRDQWELRLADDGLPEFLPPRRLDPERRPVRHRRLGGTGQLKPGRRPPFKAPQSPR